MSEQTPPLRIRIVSEEGDQETTRVEVPDGIVATVVSASVQDKSERNGAFPVVTIEIDLTPAEPVDEEDTDETPDDGQPELTE